MTFSRFSIQRKQTLVIILTTCASLLLSTIGFVTYDISSYHSQMLERMNLVAEVLGKNCITALKANDFQTADRIASLLRAEPNILAACIYTKDGRILAKYQSRRFPAKFAPPSAKAEDHQFSSDRLSLFRNIIVQNNKVGTIYLESDFPELSDRLWQYGYIVLVILLISVLVALLISSRLQRIIYGPILQLAQVSRTVAKDKNYSLRVPKETHDELGQLVDNFNEMLVQIQIRDKALQTASVELEHRVVERTRDLELEVWERKHAENMLRQQFSRLSLLNQIAHAVAARQDLPSIFLVTLQDLQAHLPADFAAVYQISVDKTELVLTVQAPGTEGETIPALEKFEAHPEYIQSMQQGEMLSIDSAAEKGCSFALNCIQAGLPKGWMIPLNIEKEPYGILVVARKNPEGFNQDEAQFLLMVCEQVSLAAHQAQLYAQLQKAYEELRATQQTVLRQERLRALGQMASGIAHDINNALVPIMGFTDLLITSPNLKASELKYLNCIKTSSQDIVGTVERMREFYRHRQDSDALTSVDLNKSAQDAINLSRPSWRDIPQEHGIVIDLKQEADTTVPTIRGIESEIRQALVNLILNSVDAMPKGGTLTLRTREIEKATLSKQIRRWACLDVTDTGIGMDEEQRRRCLEPFFSTKDARGTGLGLAMVYGVMERHEGHIEVESTPNKGTTMHLYFPIPGAARSKKTETVTNTAPPAGLRILCIDDEISVLNVLKTVLKRLGHDVVATDRGLSGVEMIEKSIFDEKPFHVVITDLGMPNMDGRAVAEAAKRLSPTSKVILLTGWGMFMDSNTEDLTNIDHVMSKPCTMKDLQAALIIVGTQKATL